MPIRVMLVDDHAAFRRSASALLESEGLSVVATSSTGEEALGQLDAQGRVEGLAPDVILVDLLLPGMDGVDVSVAVARRPIAPAVILISSHDEAATDPRVVAAPVLGFLPKRDLTCAAIRALLT